MSATQKSRGKATYVAPRSDKEWLLSVQKKLYTRSWRNPDYVFRKLWGFITDPRNLRWSLDRVSRSKGSRSAGVDGVTVRMILAKGPEVYVEELRRSLRSGEFRPSPAKRKLIPKAGKPGEFRPLGIPTLTDKVAHNLNPTSWQRLWKARCITKGARRVWERGPRRPLGENLVWRRGSYFISIIEGTLPEGTLPEGTLPEGTPPTRPGAPALSSLSASTSG